jgi:hypothetical protein
VAFPNLVIVAGGESRLDVTLTAPSPSAPWSATLSTGRRRT